MKYWPSVNVKENGREMRVFYPPTEDKSEEHDLQQYAEESTREQLRKQTPKKLVTNDDKKKASEVLKEHQDRKKHAGTKRFF
jgi:hypothetical protein